ncbi:MAG TPA: hypothetical protein VJU77_03760 [Chthoniobacterales bacterium]|nr:hypothetical protein [Chthoniobacterales bacterium]
MLSATRHKKLLLALVLLAGSSVVAFAALRIRDAVLFSHLSATEKRIIGVWEWTTVDAVGRMRIRPNHRFDEWFLESERDEDHPDSRSVTHGRWSIEGAEFVYVHDPHYPFALEHPHIPLSDFGDGMKKVH